MSATITIPNEETAKQVLVAAFNKDGPENQLTVAMCDQTSSPQATYEAIASVLSVRFQTSVTSTRTLGEFFVTDPGKLFMGSEGAQETATQTLGQLMREQKLEEQLVAAACGILGIAYTPLSEVQ